MQLSKNTSPKGKNVFLSVFFTCTSSQPAFEATSAKRKLVGVPGVEPGTSSLSGTRSNQLSYTPFKVGGGRRVRTDDIQLAKLALYQLSYTPSAVRPAPKTASRMIHDYDFDPEMVRFVSCLRGAPGRAGAILHY